MPDDGDAVDRVGRAVANIRRHLGDRAADAWSRMFPLLEAVRGIRITIRAIADAPSPDEVRDHLAEAEYFILFGHIGCGVTVEPEGPKGPDSLVDGLGVQAQVEVTRFRRMHDGPPPLDGALTNPKLMDYGDIARDSRKAFQKIVDKLRQLPGNASGLAIWNDDEDMEDIEVAIAVESIREESAAGRLTLPSGFQFVIYGSRWHGRQQYYFFALPTDHPWKSPIERTFRSSWLG
jgi:hypothetical protein